ncbi:MAG: hypothetical protein KJ666_03355 [Bacteroidetes bacterium]|nr:hypothetical protein [Bacteroidota bacterium]
MKNYLKNFSFPYKTSILIFSAVMIFLPIVLQNFLDYKNIIDTKPYLFKLILLIPSLLSAIGFIYCTLGYHFQILHGDELKLKIHLESLNIAFTATLVFLFTLIFVFLNFAPLMLNYILVILAVIAIIAYVLGAEFVKEKYE